MSSNPLHESKDKYNIQLKKWVGEPVSYKVLDKIGEESVLINEKFLTEYARNRKPTSNSKWTIKEDDRDWDNAMEDFIEQEMQQAYPEFFALRKK